jgi:serine protease AprX
MAVAVSETIIDILLLGQGDRQRQLLDLPIRGDVWAEIARDSTTMYDLLVTPHHDYSAARVARVLAERTHGAPVGDGARKMSYLTGVVAARLSLEDIWSVLIPMSAWWLRIAQDVGDDWPADTLADSIAQEFDACVARERIHRFSPVERTALYLRERELDIQSNTKRQLTRLGLLIGVLRAAGSVDMSPPTETPDAGPFSRLAEELKPREVGNFGAKALQEAWENYQYLESQEPIEGKPLRGLIWSASSNRRAEFATSRSVPAIKADAARQLFAISCKGISWAVLDSGIDREHPAFAELPPGALAGLKIPAAFSGAGPPPSRIKATYDFGNIREILNTGNKFDEDARKELTRTLAAATRIAPKTITETLLALAEAMGDERAVDWAAIEPLVRRDDPERPLHPHGTHVAGILAGCWLEADAAGTAYVKHMGVCPDLTLYDFRVLGPDAEQTEFAVIAALQFIGYLNRRNAYPVIDGINMSLSIAHNVRNYACGYTPVCVEAEARIAQGVVVVAAAGNRGYQQFRLSDGSAFASYAASSITDPGNAEGVITVGSTHRFWPHTYGISFFSSRGPTGDGRVKPDIVAPGERIESTIPMQALDAKDGTSMATPHVSGAAALLIARHRELRGQPARIKAILCENATDLGRDRCFQGHGMVDVLRAIQAV